MDEFIDRYQVIEKLGEGSSGAVYRAVDGRISREVVIKLFASYDKADTPRFLREMQTAATLEHPAIVPVYDFGEFENQPFYVMRFMGGGSLESYLHENGPLSPQEASEYLNRMASALDTIHRAGLVHRNIKPSNILLDEQGLPYLGDFAIVHTTHTETAAFIGTPAYMAPEQITGERLDNRTDIYLLGLILFEMLTGKRPFPGGTLQEIIFERLHTGTPPSLHSINPSLSADYDKVISQALAKNPANRYTTAGEMAGEFAILVSMGGKVTIIEPVINPFVVGNPVAGNLFVGRAEIFARLQELWGNDASHNVNSIVLFGHRRMGKTSILQNLHHYFGSETIVAGLTMQRLGRLHSTGELLSYLALALYDALEDGGFSNIPEPDPADYEPNGYPAFNRFLRNVHRSLKSTRQPKRVILTIDEFELIEEAIENGRIDAEFLDFLRGVIHSEPWLILALAGLHTLEEMTANYWNPLFASVTPVRVSFFNRTATGNLLAILGESSPLSFTNAAADHIFALAQGQPYLTQLIAYNLVSDYNQAAFERNETRPMEFAPRDVNRVIESRAFYEQGRYYFNGVWGQAEKCEPAEQITIMQALATSDTPLDEVVLSARAGLKSEDMRASLTILQQHDVLRELENGRFDFTVPLMRRWIRDVKL